MLFFFVGAYIGIIVDSREFKGCHRLYNTTSTTKKVLRILMSILLIVPLYVCPVYLIKSSKYVVLVMFAKYGVPSFLTALALFGFSKILYLKFGLLQPENIKIHQVNINEDEGEDN